MTVSIDYRRPASRHDTRQPDPALYTLVWVCLLVVLSIALIVAGSGVTTSHRGVVLAMTGATLVAAVAMFAGVIIPHRSSGVPAGAFVAPDRHENPSERLVAPRPLRRPYDWATDTDTAPSHRDPSPTRIRVPNPSIPCSEGGTPCPISKLIRPSLPSRLTTT